MNDLLRRVVRLVVVAHTRYPGITPHHWTCASERSPDEDCDCGADILNESMDLLKDTLKASGEPQWHPTEKELQEELDALVLQNQG